MSGRCCCRAAIATMGLLFAACGTELDANGRDEAVDAGPSDAGSPSRIALVAKKRGKGLPLRAKSSGDSKLVARIPSLARLRVKGEAIDGWVPVAFRGQEGWVASRKVRLFDEGEKPETSTGYNFLLPWRDGTTHEVTQGHGGFSHDGISKWAWDFGMPSGTPVVASHAGRVRKVKGDSQRGGCNSAYIYDANYVTIDRGDGLESHYVHLKSVRVSAGDRVERGQVIGKSGATGFACGAHLHFQVQKSPSGGGTTAGANQSVRAFFWDRWIPEDPAAGDRPASHNNTAGVP